MKVSVRPLNKGETFCCSIGRVKDCFKDTDVHLNFAYYGRDHSAFEPSSEATYWRKKIKGRIIVHMYVNPLLSSPLLSFYPIKETSFSNEQKREFEENYLHLFYDMYISVSKEKDLIKKSKVIIAELIDGKIEIHNIVL